MSESAQSIEVINVGRSEPSPARWGVAILIGAAFLVLPLPFFLAEVGRVPLARLVQVATLLMRLMVEEGASGALGPAFLALLAQVFGYCAVFLFTARVLRRVLRTARADLVTGVCAAIAFAMVVAAFVWPVYDTPFSVHGRSSTLLTVFR